MDAPLPSPQAIMNQREARLICRWPQLGPTVVQRLEEAGLHSIAEVLAIGADEAVDRVCRRQGSSAFRNRAASLKAFLQECEASQKPGPPCAQGH